ncbi:sensor histidine kinase [Stackebrandtia endophytica]|uniref:sensor histidine kinase n=1 Tax=Stackebrandtia endophytica TaxID=1496996 RepID=UPI001FEA6C4A|nr:ATP-binding protein [Stackebrandtia endophytica]
MTSEIVPSGRRVGSASAASFGLGVVAGALGYTAVRRRDRAAPTAEPDGWAPILESLQTAVIQLDADDGIAHANQVAENLGVIREHRLEPADLRMVVAQVRGTGQPRTGELELPESTIAVRVHVSPLPADRILIELIDISELHRVERVRRDFVANVSHELKTPVGALQLLTEALADAVDDPQAAARFTARIQHESARMARLVSELLELSRLQGAEPLPRFEPVPVERIITEAIDRGRTAATAKDIELVREGETGVTVSGSESQLATAVGNLIGNAIAYSPQDTTVTIRVGEARGWAKISVIDEGIGIAPDDIDRIFERFYRADPARSRATGGTGLGLAIVKHIAGNHAGRVEVSSMPGNGSVFTLLLPSVAVPAQETAPDVDEMVLSR